MRILVISKEAWRNEQNGGNVLSNIFRDIDAEFAQIYCNEMPPNNKICMHYYRITDREMLLSIRGKRAAGRVIDIDASSEETAPAGTESFSNLKTWFGSLLPVLREIVWKFGKWNTPEIERFIKDFNPDLIFAPCYGSNYMHRLTELVHKTARVNIISYISDDHYGNRQLQWAPWYWINHFILRRNTRRIFRHYSLVYTMTDEQKLSCERNFGANMRILRKAATCSREEEKKETHSPVKFMYAGGIYLNRWKTLGLLAREMRKLNADQIKFKLDIYTNNPLTPAMRKAINDGRTSTVHPVVGPDELKRLYSESDIALHCESFDMVNRLAVRLSFSTKIVDCLESGCAVMAICDPKQAGLAYLRKNNGAICVSSKTDIAPTLHAISENPSLIYGYRKSARELALKNHDKGKIRQQLTDDFNTYAKQ